MNNPTKVSAAILILSAVVIANITAAGSNKSTIDPYNHILKRFTLNVAHGNEVQIREILFAPGWKAPRHYHNSDLFIYVITGEFEVDMEGEGLETYTEGQALRMKPNIPMDARNPSETNSLKLAVFQVGNPDAPFVVPISQENLN
jgi:quercetin dioxygenase-like cupin family protein